MFFSFANLQLYFLFPNVWYKKTDDAIAHNLYPVKVDQNGRVSYR